MQDPSSDDLNVTLVPSTDFLSTFDYHPQTRVVYGPGTVDRLGELATELGGTRVFLVTDKGLAEAGHEQHGVDSLTAAGLDVIVYDDVHCNPTTEDVEKALVVAKQNDIDLIVGLGGGSSMDCAKGVNFLFTNGGRMEDYWGIGKATQPMLPMIAASSRNGDRGSPGTIPKPASTAATMKSARGLPKS